MLTNFITSYPFGVLTDKQKSALEFIIKKMQVSSIQQQKQQSYALATIKLETNETYEPVAEGYWLKANRVKKLYNYYKENNPNALKTIFPNGIEGTNYLGRSYVQLTHLYNYETFSKLLKIDLVGNPDLAMQPETAWSILELGMTKGLFTGRKLSDYFNEEESDFYYARRIINKLDRAIEIKEMAEKIYFVISGHLHK